MTDVEINTATMAVLFVLLSEYFGATFSAHAHWQAYLWNHRTKDIADERYVCCSYRSWPPDLVCYQLMPILPSGKFPSTVGWFVSVCALIYGLRIVEGPPRNSTRSVKYEAQNSKAMMVRRDGITVSGHLY